MWYVNSSQEYLSRTDYYCFPYKLDYNYYSDSTILTYAHKNNETTVCRSSVGGKLICREEINCVPKFSVLCVNQIVWWFWKFQMVNFDKSLRFSKLICNQCLSIFVLLQELNDIFFLSKFEKKCVKLSELTRMFALSVIKNLFFWHSGYLYYHDISDLLLYLLCICFFYAF